MCELPIIRKLGDKFPRKLSCVKKTSLGVGLITPQTAIDMLALKLWVGNKRLQGQVSNVTQAHKEGSFRDSGIRKRERRKVKQDACWKEGWIEEVEDKFSSRNIEILNEGKNIELNTKNKLIMEYAREHVEVTKGKRVILIKSMP